MKKTIITSALALISISAFADTSIPDVKGQMKVTANVAAGCDLYAENINFGALQMPLSHQSSSSDITVKCSKGAVVKLGIGFGNSNISSTTSKFTYEISANRDYGQWITLFENNVHVGVDNALSCNSTYAGYVVVFDEITATKLGYDWSSLPVAIGAYKKFVDTQGLCNSSYNRFNFSNLDSFLSSFSVMEKGTLKGNISSEQIFYSLELPNSSSTKWSLSNQYEITASGENQVIPMKANIDSQDNPTHRMTPDTYMDTLTVVLTY